jgi:hypothetical protein
MFEYELQRLQVWCIAAAAIAYTIGGVVGVSAGYFGGMLFTHFTDPISKMFKTDVERVLENLLKPEDKAKLYLHLLKAVLSGLGVGFLLLRVFPPVYAAPAAVMMAIMVTGALFSRIKL